MSRFRFLAVALVLFGQGLTVAPVAADTEVVGISRVSVGDVAVTVQGNDDSFAPVTSADGGTVVYHSEASNLVAGDSNSAIDVFSYDVASGATTRVSVDSGGAEANGRSLSPSISADGAIIVYVSEASNLVAGDSNGVADVFAYDVATGTTTRISVDSSGLEADGGSGSPVISADGGTVVYDSSATDLVIGDTNGDTDVFTYDVATGATTRISVDSGGTEGNDNSFGPAVSADGGTVVYYSYASNWVVGDTFSTLDVFSYDVTSGVNTPVSVDALGALANDESSYPAVSADGGTVVYQSYASNLVAGDTNSTVDVFLYDMASGVTTRISVDSLGTEANDESRNPAVSADGGTVVYHSEASNLVVGDTNGHTDVFSYDAATGATTRISLDSVGLEADGGSSAPEVSDDGGTVVYQSYASNLVAGDTNGFTDVFSYDVATGATTLISVDNVGTQASGEPAVASDGGTIVFVSDASNLVADDTNLHSDVFAYDVATSLTTRISVDSDGLEANGESDFPVVSANGGTIVYESDASNLVAGDTNSDTDVFAFDVASGVTSRISVDSDGLEANNDCYGPAVSADGGVVAYTSRASNLVPNDTNGKLDVFAFDVASGVTTRVSVASDGVQGNKHSWSPVVSADGGTILYHSSASNLVADDTNALADVFAYDMATGVTTRIVTNGHSPTLSADGGTVVYVSEASNLVAGDTNGFRDVFAYDMATGVTTRISVDSFGAQANNSSFGPAISADGGTIVFVSDASNLVAGDTNGFRDVFAYDVATGVNTRISVDNAGLDADGRTDFPAVSADGGTIVYESDASNLVIDDDNGVTDVFATQLNRSPIAEAFSATIAENVAVGTTIGAVAGTDLDADPLSFAIIAGDSAGSFTIGTTTGAITTAKALDFESVAIHTMTVAVSDGTLTDTTSVTVVVTDFDPFDDDDSSIFANDIEWLAQSGITQGCAVRQFCPIDNVSRSQMAAFLVRALDLPAATQDYFTDDDTSVFEDVINRLAESGITKGCGSTSFCPDDSVTRGQMAAFLVRGLGYTDNGGGDLFEDDDTSIFEADIDRMATAGVTRGCNPPENTNYCPNGDVTREQMAAFLRRALDT